MGIKEILDSLGSFARSLRIASVFPAGLLVVMNVYVILPRLRPDFDSSALPSLLFMIAIAMVISYLLYVLNYTLIALFQGASWKNTDIGARLLKEKQIKFLRLSRQIQRLQTKKLHFEVWLDHSSSENNTAQSRRVVKDLKRLEAEIVELEDERERHYPTEISGIMPTRLGNTIAAFQDSSRIRYGMDWRALWSRLVPILEENNYIDLVNVEKDAFDFLMNTFVVTLIIALELVYLNILLGESILLIGGIGAVAIAVGMILYQAMIASAEQWGVRVRVAFDLYRHILNERLGLHHATTFDEECNLWRNISTYLLYRPNGVSFDGFISQSEFHRNRQPQP